jgi:hypothetical protein
MHYTAYRGGMDYKKNNMSTDRESVGREWTYGGMDIFIYQILTRKKQWKPSKNKERDKNLSSRNRNACHSVSTALLQSVAKIGTQSTMKSSITDIFMKKIITRKAVMKNSKQKGARRKNPHMSNKIYVI